MSFYFKMRTSIRDKASTELNLVYILAKQMQSIVWKDTRAWKRILAVVCKFPGMQWCTGSQVCYGLQDPRCAMGCRIPGVPWGAGSQVCCVFSLTVESYLAILLSGSTVSIGRFTYLKVHRQVLTVIEILVKNVDAYILQAFSQCTYLFFSWKGYLHPHVEALAFFQLTATFSSNINFSFSQLQLWTAK